jgi:hypothetical protein
VTEILLDAGPPDELNDPSLIETNPFPPTGYIEQPTNGSGRLTATPLAEIAMKSIEWLERPLWQRSAFQLFAGSKGAGKGTYLAALAARISNAGSNVLFVSTEDSASIDLKPRLVAAGADIARCSLITQHVQLPEDVDDLRHSRSRSEGSAST